MTNDEIMALTAEELRIEIAKVKGAIMRWCRNDPECGGRRDMEVVYDEPSGMWSKSALTEDNGFYRWPCIHKGGLLYNPCGDWTADISAAWELVDAISQKTDVVVSHERGQIGAWACGYWIPYSEQYDWYFGDTAPLVISRAYLMWRSSNAR